MNILTRVRRLLGRKPVANAEDAAARREAERVREDMETLKTGAMMGGAPSMYGDSKESRGR